MVAYVLIKVPAKKSKEVVERLRTLRGLVKEAYAIYGEYDIIAKVEAEAPDLDRLIMEKIQGLPQVEMTRTYITIGTI